MLSIRKFIDVQVIRMPRGARWFGVNPVSPREGSIGIGIAEVAYSLHAPDRPVPVERVEPWLSSTD
jgi:hypothetical protein